MIVRARVQRGRLLVDVPTDLPDGAEIDLASIPDVLATELSAEERQALEASIATSRAQAQRGEGVDGEELIRSLRAGHR